jgi:hypothetical protein
LRGLIEAQNTKLIIIQKELRTYKELLQARKVQKKGKRVRLEGEFVYSTQEVFRIVREVEEETAAKKQHKRSRCVSIDSVYIQIEEEEPEIVIQESGSDLDELA